MTLDKAIEILSNSLKYRTLLISGDDLDATKLGIEAMKRIKARRDLKTGWEITPLPDETKE